LNSQYRVCAPPQVAAPETFGEVTATARKDQHLKLKTILCLVGERRCLARTIACNLVLTERATTVELTTLKAMRLGISHIAVIPFYTATPNVKVALFG
jgi:hypothetical protein